MIGLIIALIICVVGIFAGIYAESVILGVSIVVFLGLIAGMFTCNYCGKFAGTNDQGECRNCKMTRYMHDA